jgi:sugar-specific transcriptional regulator TrmB
MSVIGTSESPEMPAAATVDVMAAKSSSDKTPATAAPAKRARRDPDRAMPASSDRPPLIAASMQDPAIRGLVSLGLTSTEARVYASLVETAPATAADVAQRAGVARPKVYEALRMLQERGFCEEVMAGNTATFRAVAPESALEQWVRHRDHERAVSAEHDAATAEDLVRRFPAVQSAEPGLEQQLFEIVAGRTRVSFALETLVGKATSSLDNMTQPPFIQPRARWNKPEIAALGRGVRVRTLYSGDVLGDTQRWAPLVERGGLGRIAERLPMKLIIRDGEEAMISLRDPVTGDVSTNAIMVRHQDLVRPLQKFFDDAWDSAADLHPPGRVGPPSSPRRTPAKRDRQ